MDSGTRSIVWYLLAGTRGGPNRLRILEELRSGPSNAHQLALSLSIDYRTLRHHLRTLEQNGLIVRPLGRAYASPYELPPNLLAEFELVREVVVNQSHRSRGARSRSARPAGVMGL